MGSAVAQHQGLDVSCSRGTRGAGNQLTRVGDTTRLSGPLHFARSPTTTRPMTLVSTFWRVFWAGRSLRSVFPLQEQIALFLALFRARSAERWAQRQIPV